MGNHSSDPFSTVKTLRWDLWTDRGIVIVFPWRVVLNCPFTKGSQPARYCHCVPRINRDNSFPLSSYSVGTTENSSGIVSLSCPLLIVTGTTLTVPRECDLLATPLSL